MVGESLWPQYLGQQPLGPELVALPNSRFVAVSITTSRSTNRQQSLPCGLWRAALVSAFWRVPWPKATDYLGCPVHGCAVELAATRAIDLIVGRCGDPALPGSAKPQV